MTPGLRGESDAPTPQLVNFRDIGGLPLRNAGAVRAGVLYRSDAPMPGDRTPSGVAIWPPTTVIDLRSRAELAQEHPLVRMGAAVHRFPLLDRLTESGAERAEPRLAQVYRRIVSGIGEVAGPLLGVLGRAPGPVLIHCTGGKDRTGVLVAVILGLLGVEAESIRADYRRSAVAMPALLERHRHGGNRYRPDVLGVPDSAIDVVFSTIGAEPAEVEAWLRGHGASPGDIAAVRTGLTADAGDVR
ncbi:tyrosine-protein phosphatase [Nocardia jinanensis]|uniref:Protein-tyrosine-phosphatase n=1 Tax=Nocardia jinanensis TaxID=382504 RepID=A0A917RKW0_9NOCA|nr:tyrosine-protein phosphatase [Nocardia jinanensis]GGL13365.1 protein-tyrosine-phosphatase [Nocardia jinanensis]